MNTNELCEKLLSSCAGGMSALRAIVKLVPAGGDGDKVSPPTHEGGKYAFEERVVEGRSDVKTVLLDSVQSQANRLEDALLTAVRAGDIRIPLLQMDISGHQTITSLSALEHAAAGSPDVEDLGIGRINDKGSEAGAGGEQVVQTSVRFSSSTSSSNYPLEITALTVVSPFSGGLSKLQHFRLDRPNGQTDGIVSAPRSLQQIPAYKYRPLSIDKQFDKR
jgi:hypothetical protein